MMKRFSPLLLELICMVMVFALCAAICVSILEGAWNLSRNSEHLTQAVYLAENAAARLQAGVPYEGSEEGDYAVILEKTLESGLTDTLISVKYEEVVIFTLTVTEEMLS